MASIVEIEHQNERAFQKQPTIFLAGKQRLVGKKAGKPVSTKKPVKLRFVRNVGLGFKTPKAASQGTYVDKKCPFTGNVSIRGRILRGIVQSTKMKRTIIVRRDYLHYIPKYNRFEKRHTNIPAHCSPCFSVKDGDIVTIGQCRPLSKTVRFNVLDHTPQSSVTQKKQFRIF